jgi:hypothetical protein
MHVHLDINGNPVMLGDEPGEGLTTPPASASRSNFIEIASLRSQ